VKLQYRKTYFRISVSSGSEQDASHHGWRHASRTKIEYACMQNTGTKHSESVIASRKPTTMPGSSDTTNAAFSSHKAGIGGGFMLSVTSN
jgi:hypothetical protein